MCARRATISKTKKQKSNACHCVGEWQQPAEIVSVLSFSRAHDSYQWPFSNFFVRRTWMCVDACSFRRLSDGADATTCHSLVQLAALHAVKKYSIISSYVFCLCVQRRMKLYHGIISLGFRHFVAFARSPDENDSLWFPDSMRWTWMWVPVWAVFHVSSSPKQRWCGGMTASVWLVWSRAPHNSEHMCKQCAVINWYAILNFEGRRLICHALRMALVEIGIDMEIEMT